MANSPQVVLGFVGRYCAGKGMAIAYLAEKYGFLTSSCSDRIREEIRKNSQEITRENLQTTAGRMRKELGPAVLAIKTWQFIQENSPEKAAIDSIRGLEEVDYFKANVPNFYLVAIDVDQRTRFERMLERTKLEGRADLKTWEEFVRSEERDNNQDGRNIDGCIKRADFTIENNGTTEEFYQKIDQLLKKIYEG